MTNDHTRDLELRALAGRVHQSLGTLVEDMRHCDGPASASDLRTIGVALTRLGVDMISRADDLDRRPRIRTETDG